MDIFAGLIEELAQFVAPTHVLNPYALRPEDASLAKANQIRRHNLLAYWRLLDSSPARLLLVGEAPGYRGCRLTGIPFSSERILQQRSGPGQFFDRAHGFRLSGESLRPQAEATATMVWDVVDRLPQTPLFWNAFPFHPHRPARPSSNRPPNGPELLLGQAFLEKVVYAFQPRSIIAVGNKAAGALRRAKLPHQKVRHPSHGGREMFEEQLLALVG